MFQFSLVKIAARLTLLFFCLSTIWQPVAIYAQAGENVQELKLEVIELIKQRKYTEALPILEKLAIAEPNRSQTHYFLGLALIAQADITKDDAARKALRIRARNAFLKSKELGIEEPAIDAFIQGIPPDGSEDKKAFSENAAVNKLMVEGEGFFEQGKLNDALRNYQRALQLEPTLYDAALFSGDVFNKQDDYSQAETWYQKAIAIDPTRETAYRYSATPLMKQGKYDQARDRYVEAYISEPYNQLSIAGLARWAQATNTTLAHPKIDIPTNVTFDEKRKLTIYLDPNTFLSGKDDGSSAWIVYGLTRPTWRLEKFAKLFPHEKTYRHSLAEEADALRSVLTVASGDKKVKNLNPSLAKLKKLNDEGLLEAYILLARPNEGIVKDHPSYLKQNRDKLRRYVVEYNLTGGGK